MPGIARALAAGLLLIGAPAFAQNAREADNYPSRAIRMIVPFPPGGPADTIARVVGAKMSEHWGQPVGIENRAGGNPLTGAVDFALDSVSNSLPLIEAGKFRALAKYSNRPLPLLPDVPSLAAAAGLPDLAESSTWIGVVAPAGTPKPVIDKVQREIAAIYAEPVMAARLEKAGLNAESSTPEELDAYIRSESARWGKLIKSGIADKILN